MDTARAPQEAEAGAGWAPQPRARGPPSAPPLSPPTWRLSVGCAGLRAGLGPGAPRFAPLPVLRSGHQPVRLVPSVPCGWQGLTRPQAGGPEAWAWPALIHTGHFESGGSPRPRILVRGPRLMGASVDSSEL